jgi:hypothetical protein
MDKVRLTVQQAVVIGVVFAVLVFGLSVWAFAGGGAWADWGDQALNSETPSVAYPGPDAQELAAYPEPEIPNPDAEVGREWVPVPDDLPEGCFPLYFWPMNGTYKHVGGTIDARVWVYFGDIDVRIDGDVTPVDTWDMYPQGGDQMRIATQQGEQQGKNWIRMPDYTSAIGCGEE